MAPATDYRGVLPAFCVPLRQVAARFVAIAPTRHGEGACARGGAAPLSPPRILLPILHHLQRENTHNRERRERRTHHITHHATLTQHDTTPLPANPANLANTKTWYGEGIERVRSRSRLRPPGFFLDERIIRHKTPKTTKNPQNQP